MDTDKIIQNAFNALEPKAKQALSKVPWKDRVKSIATREQLNNDKTSQLETETMLILYRLADPANFAFNISEQLSLDEDKSVKIAQEVFDEIVSPIETEYEKTTTQVPESSLPEVLPGENVHVVEPVKISVIQAPQPPTPMTKPTLVPTPTYTAPATPASTEDAKRPNLNLPQSNYNQGQDPYREPLE